MVTVTVDVDVDQVLEELSDDELLEAIKDRGLFLTDSAPKGLFTARDLTDMKDAAEAGRAYDLLAIVQAAFCPSRPFDTIAATYAALPRDPASGRPVIQ